MELPHPASLTAAGALSSPSRRDNFEVSGPGPNASQAPVGQMEEQKRFRALVSQISDVICLLDEAGQVKYVSASITRVLGYTSEERIGRSAFELLHNDYRSSGERTTREVLKFPKFMDGVEEVRQLDDKRTFWKAQIAGKTSEWEAEIYEQIPDSRIAWRSTTGAPNAGAVSFQAQGTERTKVTLVIDYQPMGVVEKVGDALGIVSARVEGDLQRFKKFIEERGVATGGWRGEIR